MLLISSCATLPGHLHNLSTDKVIATNRVLTEIIDSKVIFIGESHDSDVDHLMQLEILRQLNEHGKRVLIALEMFPSAYQHILDAWIYDTATEDQFINAYMNTWRIPYAYYEDIFDYAKKHQIKLSGINLTPDRIKQLIRSGVTEESEAELDKVKFSPCAKEFLYAQAMQIYWDKLGHKSAFDRLCNVRRFKEAFMAYQISHNLQKNIDAIIVILGSAHAQKNAVPDMLRRQGEVSIVVLLPEHFSLLLGSNVTERHTDLLWHEE